VAALNAPLPLEHAGSRPTAVAISFDVPGVPQPQGSTKAFKHRSSGRVVVTSDNVRLRPWRDAVCWHARQALAGHGPLDGPISVSLEFCFSRPAGHFGKRGLRPTAPREHVVRPDVDKLTRAALDALGEAGVWRDDAQVVWVRARKAYGEAPGVRIAVVRPAGGQAAREGRA
jgi:Holliday junction resolvase RusA-like endonuclease